MVLGKLLLCHLKPCYFGPLFLSSAFWGSGVMGLLGYSIDVSFCVTRMSNPGPPESFDCVVVHNVVWLGGAERFVCDGLTTECLPGAFLFLRD